MPEKRMTTHPFRQFRRDKATERQAERDQRTDAEQLALLRERGHGHCAEAKALALKIEKEEAGHRMETDSQ